ncbi:putative Serine/threonine-protein kinase CTR1 [Hypsibius exemplaris]|uniref:Serine/threonine-protein kinase CTR1 n=1 Tax=Hypsibius exemplaris TaxID=2072580 RepID=A0A1W0WJ40_HYPEX|nr:putative Serine/threonine-protein kinase CTR1 [Hypsibius exemplaris]
MDPNLNTSAAASSTLPATKKPTKSLVRFCKLLTRAGHFVRKIQQNSPSSSSSPSVPSVPSVTGPSVPSVTGPSVTERSSVPSVTGPSVSSVTERSSVPPVTGPSVSSGISPAIKISCCSTTVEDPVFPRSLLPSDSPIVPSRFLNIPGRVDCSSLLSTSSSGVESACSSCPSSPGSPKSPASYPPTPDHLKFPAGQWEAQASPADSGFGDSVFSFASQEDVHDESLRTSTCCEDYVEVRDWAVDYADLEVKAKVQQNATGDFHRGQWHGNVLIYRHTDQSASSIRDFRSHVERQSKIRHDNVLLFLGAAVDNAEQLAIVLQPPQRQQSLHQLLNSPRRLNKLPHNFKWNMALQLAQAVAYVHAKDVCVGAALHSGNVFLEAKIKLSLLDFGFGGRQADVMFPRCNSTSTHTAATASRNINYLTSFLAPEVLPLYSAAAGCGNNNVSSSSVYTEATDSFAFGSLLYEIFTEQKPFKSLAEREQFAALLDRSDIPSNVQEVIGQCWNRNPADRPSFPEILDSLTNRQPFLLSGRSFSQPDLFAQQSRAL